MGGRGRTVLLRSVEYCGKAGLLYWWDWGKQYLYPNIQVDIDMFRVDRNRRRLVDGHNLMRLDIIL